MKDQVLLPETGYYKANLHCHTTISDGKLTPEETKRVYQEQGYSIIAFTDHHKYRWHRELDDKGFLALAAYEADLTEEEKPGKDWPRRKTYHLNLFDTNPEKNREQKERSPSPTTPYHDLEGLNRYIREMNELGFLVCYNHPYWSLQTCADYEGLQDLFAMEIYNHSSEIDGMNGFHPQAYDETLRSGQRLTAVAADDNHNHYPPRHALYDACGGFVQIAAEKLEYQSVISALRAGRFYWSMGPELRGVSIKDNVLSVTTSPVQKIFVLQEGRDSYKAAAAPGETLTHAEFPLTGSEGWFRIMIHDCSGFYAGTNAYFIRDLY